MKTRKIQNKKVIVAMSGGVDSSVAAALLKNQGYSVVGVFMKFWSPLQDSPLINVDSNIDLRRYENRCCSSDSERRARQVAKILEIPFYVFNFEKEFKKRVVDYFLRENKAGKTPNPCVVCNKEIKFGLLLEKALKLGADFVATGHYARIRKFVNSKQIRYSLISAKDKEKDQSYFLWRLNQKQLKHILFPIGDYTRKEVEEMAKKFKLPFEGVKKSQEICFIPKTVEDFLENYLKTNPGRIIDTNSKVLGEHKGLWFYTIGQRKGIELSGGPFYVVDKDFKKNNLIVANHFDNKKLYKKSLIVKNVNWIAGMEPKLSLKIMAQIRYRHKPVSVIIVEKLKNGNIKLVFARLERAVTPGQSAVFYKNNELLGGGIITSE
jgi:tRNA-specific 2-thiouridylase